jgi:photosystem II stability/assembly factor-like uncharacterized protein
MIEAPGLLVGPIFAVAFDLDGRSLLAATAAALYRSEDGAPWSPAPLPRGSAPARAIVPLAPGHVLLAGWAGLFRTDDGGRSWVDVGATLGEATSATVTSVPGRPDRLYLVAGRRLLTTEDGARSWQPVGPELPASSGIGIGVEPQAPERLWIFAAGRLQQSVDGGLHWEPAGQGLPEAPEASALELVTRALAVGRGGRSLTLATDRGLYRSADGGQHWALLAEPLPAHLEAGLLVRDPHDPDTLYAGFALTPYGELWRQAVEGTGALGRVSAWGWVGGGAVLLLLTGAAGIGLRSLARRAARYPTGSLPVPGSRPPSTPSPPPGRSGQR